MSSVPTGRAGTTVHTALRASRSVHGMQAAAFVVLTPSGAVYQQVTGELPGLSPGLEVPRGDALAARMLDGAPAAAADVGAESAFAGTAEPGLLGVRGYVAHSVLDDAGHLLGVLVGLDREASRIGPAESALLRGIADGLGRALAVGGIDVTAPAAAAAGTPSAPGPVAGPAPDEAPRPAPPGGAARPAAPAAPAEPAEPAQPERHFDEHPADEHPVDERPADERHAAARRPEDRPRAEPRHAPSGPPSPATLAAAAAAGRPTGRPSPPRPAPPGRPAAPSRRPTERPGIGPTGPEVADTRLRRSPAGWIVEGPGTEVRPVGDLISAMVLADLLAEDLAPPGRPRRPDHELSELERLRLSVSQLEHALASRVVVEQAIGVLAERHHIRPREAFERLRRTARGMGRRVHDLARQVVESITDPRATLPGELAGRAGAPRPSPPRTGAPPRR